MSTPAERLAAWGILRAPEVVELATAAGLELAAAAALLVKESGGGRNVWGGDAVAGRGTLYRPGEVVTRAAYERYRAELLAGRAGQQGVGPTQLTAREFQAAADRIGGCWDWRANVLTGFRILAGHIGRYGLRGGFVAYNGGPGALSRSVTHPAQIYGDASMALLQRWRDRLGTTPTPYLRPASAPQEDDDMDPEERAALFEVRAALFEVRDMLRALKPGVVLPGRSAGTTATLDDQYGWTLTAAARADDAASGVRELLARPAAAPVAGPSADEVAEALIRRLGGAA